MYFYSQLSTRINQTLKIVVASCLLWLAHSSVVLAAPMPESAFPNGSAAANQNITSKWLMDDQVTRSFFIVANHKRMAIYGSTGIDDTTSSALVKREFARYPVHQRQFSSYVNAAGQTVIVITGVQRNQRAGFIQTWIFDTNAESSKALLKKISHRRFKTSSPDIAFLSVKVAPANTSSLALPSQLQLAARVQYNSKKIYKTVRGYKVHHEPNWKPARNKIINRTYTVTIKQKGVIVQQASGESPASVSRYLANKEHIKKLHTHFRPMVKELLEVSSDAGFQLRITSGYRSIKEQDDLYEQGRTTPGPIVTYVRGGYSWHNFGLAIDLFDMQHDNYDTVNWAAINHLASKIDGHWEWGYSLWQFDKPHWHYSGGLSLAEVRLGKYPPVPERYEQ